MKISDLSIKNPVFAWMLMFGLMIFGLISFSRMGVSQLPDVDFPTVTVNVTLVGAAPEVMETQVVDPIESALMGVEGVQSITSNSKTGSANITVEFSLDRNIDIALQDVQAKVAGAQKQLPKEVDPPTISKTNPDDQPILWLALTYDKNDPQFLMKYARDYLRDRFTTVDGVGDIFLGGYTDPVLRVSVDTKKLPSYNISVNDVIDAIKNEHSELPGGYIETEKNNYNVRTMGEAKTIEEFKNIVISKRAGQTTQDPTNMVRIRNVADVQMTLDDITRVSRFNGEPALGLGIRKQRGTNAVAVAKAVKEKIKEIQPQLPEGMKIHVNFDSTQFIEKSVGELTHHLMLAVILTSLVCWMFLGSWSATFNVLLSIPTSLLGAFIGLYFLGYTLNTFTLLGLTLAIGIVVDDAIMVLENIFRYNEKGHGQIESAILGAREIGFAALAATAAVIAIFLPVAFMQGIIGKFFMQFGVTISLAVFLSLVESLTITPMRCAGFVHHGERTTKIGRAFEAFMASLVVGYERLLRKSLSHRWTVILGSIVFVVISFFSIKFLTKEMSPAQDQSIFMARLILPVGSSLAYTDGQVKKAEEWLRSRPEVKQVYASVGGFGGGISDANTAMMFVTMKEYGERPKDKETGKRLSQQDFMQIARKELSKIQDVRPVLMDMSQRGFSSGRGYPIEFTVLGSDWGKLADMSQKIMKEMQATGTMVDVDSNYLLGMPEIQVVPDRIAAAQHGVSINAIGTTVNAMIGGVKAGQYADGGHRYDIKVKLSQDEEAMKEIKTLLIGNYRSNLIPISKVTKQEMNKSLQSISRSNRQRAITITANLKPGASQQDAMNKVEAIAKQVLEPGYMIDQGGSSKTFKESFRSLIFALVMGLVIAYMVLASQFNSFIDPVTILMALPFSFSGAFFALLITGQSLNMYSMIGLLLLMGIVKKNSILLIEFTNTTRDRGTTEADAALIEACPVRLRPILMTSIATIAAAIPSATATGAGSETMRPMALCLIGGVLVSTVLTLFVVPCVYSLMDRFRKRDEVREKTKRAFEAVGDEALS
ncbi:efflux RND transporter permease subunit [Bdellovibrio svalbardensis]|uniref:Efflux RND transporter permease subunit n=1 Tax=Bdellovibrio svalbardensis TaxID=2972972 RepID=A0ABT6DQ84_9BACT|nr:efflux RND transporter permease subunit [Bdellovibrio svalbardensis]MDG0817996.1 efflux RND transporter permease subunit [Bdellovibrio svalbardensis]